MPKPYVPDDINYSFLPTKRLRDAMRRYLNDGYQPGRFLTAVIENKFVTAVCGADREHYPHLREIAWFIYNEAPGNSWGSKEKRLAWQKLFENGDAHVQPSNTD